jgi:hypothetical protein
VTDRPKTCRLAGQGLGGDRRALGAGAPRGDRGEVLGSVGRYEGSDATGVTITHGGRLLPSPAAPSRRGVLGPYELADPTPTKGEARWQNVPIRRSRVPAHAQGAQSGGKPQRRGAPGERRRRGDPPAPRGSSLASPCGLIGAHNTDARRRGGSNLASLGTRRSYSAAHVYPGTLHVVLGSMLVRDCEGAEAVLERVLSKILRAYFVEFSF